MCVSINQITGTTRFHVEPYFQMQDRSACLTVAKICCTIIRYQQKLVDAKARICRRCCLNCTENEEHFLLRYNADDEPRDKRWLLFWELVTNFGKFAPRKNFMLMMSNENLGLIKEIATFVENAFELREQSLSC